MVGCLPGRRRGCGLRQPKRPGEVPRVIAPDVVAALVVQPAHGLEGFRNNRLVVGMHGVTAEDSG